MFRHSKIHNILEDLAKKQFDAKLSKTWLIIDYLRDLIDYLVLILKNLHILH